MVIRTVIGRHDRRSAYAAAVAFVAAILAFPAFAAADPPEEGGAVVEALAPSHQAPWGWSRQRLEEAEPLPIIELPEPAAPAAPQEPAGAAEGSTPMSAETGGARTAAVSQSGATEGVEVAAAESTLFPNSANGKLFGTYEVRINAREYKREDYVCSASVVKPAAGSSFSSNVVLTAGHCAIDPETGTKTNSEMIFIPGYRNGSAPYGVWPARFFTTTETWKNTAKAGVRPNEGGDVAFIGLGNNFEGQSIEEVVGSLGIAFDQVCNQSYTQFGYPSEAPYGGELLYSHNAAYAGADTTGGFLPVPMKIASDFTRGASGGPWAVGIGSGAPTVLSLTAYSYESQPGYLYGPYFGEAAKKAYGAAFGKTLPAGIEETCAALPAPPPIPPTPTPTPTPPSTQPPPGTTVPPSPPVTLKVTRVRSLANGSAVLTAKVNAAGVLKLTGAAVRAESLATPAAGRYRMVVAAKGAKVRLLRQVGKTKVGVKIAFSASGKTKRVSKKIALSRRTVASASQRRSPTSR